MLASTLIPLVLSLGALATPFQTSGCNLDNAVVTAGTLPVPTNPLSYVTLGVGYQNYTCGTAGTFAAAGAVANIYDISCLYGRSGFDKLADIAMAVWNAAPAGLNLNTLDKFPTVIRPKLMGEHFFITNPITGAGISPKWDFTRTFTNDPAAFVVAARSAAMPAPEGIVNVDWLYLKSMQGNLATEVYRTDTRAGQPPSSCTPGATTQVKYVSKYWLTGTTVKL